MSKPDFRDVIEPALRPLLETDEHLLAASPLVPDPGTAEDVSVADELKNLLDPSLLVGLGAHPGDALQQATFGRALVGGSESSAGKLFAAVENAMSPTITVTENSILIVHLDTTPPPGASWFQRWFGRVEYSPTLLHTVSRRDVAAVRSAPRGVLRGRFLIGFTDGSGCALVCAPPSRVAGVVTALQEG